MGLVPVPPDWPPLRTEEVRRLLARLVGLEDASAARITWHSPRPFAATAVISVPGTGGGEPLRLVVKRHHRAVRTRTSLQAEHAFMQHLAAQGVAVPRALDDGARSAWAEDDFVYEVLELLDGHDLYREARSWTPFTSMGHAQAAGGRWPASIWPARRTSPRPDRTSRCALRPRSSAAPGPSPPSPPWLKNGRASPASAPPALAPRARDQPGPSTLASCPMLDRWRPLYGPTTTGTRRTCFGRGHGRTPK